MLFDDLHAAGFLRNLDTKTFSVKAAHFLAELNAIHAFREGNGRSQLTIASFAGDESKLAAVIEGLIS